MEYGLSGYEKTIIADCKKQFPELSIFILMRRLKCTPEKAAFIVKKFFSEEVKLNEKSK